MVSFITFKPRLNEGVVKKFFGDDESAIPRETFQEMMVQARSSSTNINGFWWHLGTCDEVFKCFTKVRLKVAGVPSSSADIWSNLCSSTWQSLWSSATGCYSGGWCWISLFQPAICWRIKFCVCFVRSVGWISIEHCYFWWYQAAKYFGSCIFSWSIWHADLSIQSNSPIILRASKPGHSS